MKRFFLKMLVVVLFLILILLIYLLIKRDSWNIKGNYKISDPKLLTPTDSIVSTELSPLDIRRFSWSSGVIEGQDGDVKVKAQLFIDRSLSERKSGQVTKLEEIEPDGFDSVANGVAVATGILREIRNGKYEVEINIDYHDDPTKYIGKWLDPVDFNPNIGREKNRWKEFKPDNITIIFEDENEHFYPSGNKVDSIGIGVHPVTGGLIIRLGIPNTVTVEDHLDFKIYWALTVMTNLHVQQLPDGQVGYPRPEELDKIEKYWDPYADRQFYKPFFSEKKAESWLTPQTKVIIEK